MSGLSEDKKGEGALFQLNAEPEATLQTFEIVENGLVEHRAYGCAGGAAGKGTTERAYDGARQPADGGACWTRYGTDGNADPSA